MRWRSRSPEETRAAAAALGAALRGALVIGLEGALGSGKTVFAKGLAAGLGVDPERVASPTFVIASEYPVAGPVSRLVHADFYRVESALELEAAGLEDWLGPDTLLVAEWADRHPEQLPGDRLTVRLAGGGSDRVLEIEALGPASEAVLERWRRAWR